MSGQENGDCLVERTWRAARVEKKGSFLGRSVQVGRVIRFGRKEANIAVLSRSHHDRVTLR
jgi:hypothetical protein